MYNLLFGYVNTIIKSKERIFLMKKRNFLVSNDGKYLYITVLGNSKNTGRIYYTDYSAGLEKLLNSGIFGTAITNGTSEGNHLKLYYAKSQKRVYFHHIVFGFYYRNLTAENYQQVLIQAIWIVARKKSPPRRRMHKPKLPHKSKQWKKHI